MRPKCPLCGSPMRGFPEGEIAMDPKSGFVRIRDRFAHLTPTHMKMFITLYERYPRAVSREYLMDSIYGLECEDEPDIRIINVMVYQMRKRLKHTDITIQSAGPGKGYRLAYREQK